MTTTDEMVRAAQRLADRIRREADLARGDTQWLWDILAAALRCEDIIRDARNFTRRTLRDTER